MGREQTIRRQARCAPAESLELLGDLHPLLAQLGSAEALVRLSTAAEILHRPRVESVETLALFLEAYWSEILLPIELPAIGRAYFHASRNETRELLLLDQQVGVQWPLRDFASASRRVGKSQLQRLRPLRGERLLQRYLQAVERGDAEGWHTLVYGLTLALYSLPLRQGLLSYTRRTLRGFTDSAARPLGLSEAASDVLVEELCQRLPPAIEAAIDGTAERA